MPETGMHHRPPARTQRNLTPDFADFLAARTERGADTDIMLVRAVVKSWHQWCRERLVARPDIRVGSALEAAGYRITNLKTTDSEAVVRGLRLRPVAPLLALPKGLEPDDVAALSLIAGELARVRTVEGYIGVRDDLYPGGELERAAGEYLHIAGSTLEQRKEFPAGSPGLFWPWLPRFWKPTTPQGDGIKGGALAVAALARRLRVGGAA